MSKFFRSTGSSSSEDSASEDEEEEDTEEVLNQSLSHLDSRPETSFESIAIDRSADEPNAQDYLVHALLEERCLNEVTRERDAIRDPRQRLSDDQMQREAQRRYRQLCTQLATINVVTRGPEDVRHGVTRQRVRDGLDRMLRSGTVAAQPAFPGPLRRLLTDSNAQSMTPPSGLAAFHQSAAVNRYMNDYDEIGVLGRGGYGEVFHVRHRLDACFYAVKKVPIRPSMVRRIATEGDAVLDEILVEVRSLSKLDHPNVVRYHHSWIEWSAGKKIASSSGEEGTSAVDGSADAILGATNDNPDSLASQSLHRVQTQSDTTDELGFVFESRSHQSASIVDSSIPNGSASDLTRSSKDDALLATTDSPLALALHMQMDIYPMTLADFLSPKTSGPVKPLAHCFHLDPSLHILLAILDGVEYIHSQGIIHRDLKPANIFLRPENNTKTARGCVNLFECRACQASKEANPATLGIRIGDFGLVANIAQTANISTSGPMAVGTEIYRPASSKSSISPRLDIFALGIIACELLCKFNTQMERRETLHALKRGKYPDFGSCAGQKSGQVKDCVAAMLAERSLDEDAIAELRRRFESLLSSKETVVEVSNQSPLRRSST